MPLLKLSDGLDGGGTAFPKHGVAAFPVKGSVVFWHSLTTDGSVDPMSLHGGCPTIHGIKWGEFVLQNSPANSIMLKYHFAFSQWPTSGFARERNSSSGLVFQSSSQQLVCNVIVKLKSDCCSRLWL
jgi:hypothetical protein